VVIALRGGASLALVWAFRRHLPPWGAPHWPIAIVGGVLVGSLLWVGGPRNSLARDLIEHLGLDFEARPDAHELMGKIGEADFTREEPFGLKIKKLAAMPAKKPQTPRAPTPARSTRWPGGVSPGR
jgi:hypothetical protein